MNITIEYKDIAEKETVSQNKRDFKRKNIFHDGLLLPEKCPLSGEGTKIVPPRSLTTEYSVCRGYSQPRPKGQAAGQERHDLSFFCK